MYRASSYTFSLFCRGLSPFRPYPDQSFGTKLMGKPKPALVSPLRSARGWLLLTTLLTLTAITGCAQGVQLLPPLHGIQGKDYWINNYVSHDETGTAHDAFCGTKTYAGHNGTDFAILSFKTMDSGVTIYASAPGVVTEVVDGNPDRNKKKITGTPDNHVVILTGGKYYVMYFHMLKNSTMVHKGDVVKAGQPIGKVGSSGASAYPHVHLEVRDMKQNVIDPFTGPCQTATPGMWARQPAYDTALYAKDFGFVAYNANFDSLSERIGVRDTFYTGTDHAIYFWIQMHAPARNYNVSCEWYTPAGVLATTTGWVWTGTGYNAYGITHINMLPAEPGPWSVRCFFNGALACTKNFFIINKP